MNNNGSLKKGTQRCVSFMLWEEPLTTVEAASQFRSWGSRMDLEGELEMSAALCLALSSGSDPPLPGFAAREVTSPTGMVHRPIDARHKITIEKNYNRMSMSTIKHNL